MTLSFLFALIISTITARLLLHRSLPFNSLDVPGERSLHSEPTPRLGGIAIICGIVGGWGYQASLFSFPWELRFLFVSSVLVAGISVADDFFSLSPSLRLCVHMIAGGIITFGLLNERVPLPLIFPIFFGTVWMTNLFNFMDGLDGFAGGMALIGFGALGSSAYLGGAETLANIIWVPSAAALGFLFFNFPPAQIFMGDVGSTTLGFLAAGFSLLGCLEGAFSPWVPVLIFSPFIVDSTVTLLRRALLGEKVWLPHRKHFFQRLVQAGWSHRQTLLCGYFLMLACSTSTLAMAVKAEWVWPGMILWAGFYVLLALLVEHRVRVQVPFS